MDENTKIHPSLDVNLFEFLAARGNQQIYLKYKKGRCITYWANDSMDILACFVYPILSELEADDKYLLSKKLRRFKLTRHYDTSKWEIVIFRYRNQIIRCTTKI